MNILMTSLFDPDLRHGISVHESQIVTSLTRNVRFDVAVINTKAGRDNKNLAVRLCQFGTARLEVFYNQGTMTIACARLLLLKVTGVLRPKFQVNSSYVLLGYHWVFWLPFLRSARKMIFIPFDCWSAREERLSSEQRSIHFKLGRQIWSRIVRAFEFYAAGRVDIFGFVSRDEIEKYVRNLDPELTARVLSRSVVLPFARSLDKDVSREILSAKVSRILIWMDCRISYGLRSMTAAVRAIDNWRIERPHQRVDVVLLSRESISQMKKNLSPCVDWTNVEFVDNDLPSFLASFDIIILPDLTGSGLKNRTIDSIASGSSVIATVIAAEGLSKELKETIHILEDLDQVGSSLDDIFSDRQNATTKAWAAQQVLYSESHEAGERDEFVKRVVLELDAV